MSAATLDQARAAKERLSQQLRNRAEVNGIGITRLGESFAVRINCANLPDVPLPDQVDGVPVTVVVIGPIVKQGAGKD